MTENDILEFLSNTNYDLRISHNGRWIDQKCTPDVLWSISDFISYYVDNINEVFTVNDIWHSNYAKETIRETFSKPETDETTAENEYDKVFSQPINLLCYAGILNDISNSSRHLYRVSNRDVLNYIARNDVYALRFLQMYIEKVLTDSGLIASFNTFFDLQTKEAYMDLKESFASFYHRYTPVKKDYEPNRIFTKVINPLAFKYGKLGSERGHISKDVINRSDMMYNRDNFRDIYRDKPKGVTRQEWRQQQQGLDIRTGYFEQQMNAAKRLVRTYNDNNRNGISELTQFNIDHTDNAPATQIHHIFPKNEFPDIMHLIENLIALTPNQHYGFAHPNNNTQIIDIAAQKVLLIAKLYSIKYNLEQEADIIYNFDNMLLVLSIGWNDDNILEISKYNYQEVLYAINTH